MQEWLDNNDIFKKPTHNEGNSVIDEIFIKTLKAKTYKKLTANDKKSYIFSLNKLADHLHNTYHHFVIKKSIVADYSALT